MYDPLLREVQTTNPDGTYARTLYRPFEKSVADEEDTASSSPHFDTPTTFRYDGLGRQVQTLERKVAAIYTTSYGYDVLDNLVLITDALGNIKRQTFDSLKRKLWMDDPDRGQMTYTYDDAGNLSETLDAKGQRIGFTYDGANRLLAENDITAPGDSAPEVRYHYDDDLAPEYPEAVNTRGRLAWVEDTSGREYLSYDGRGNLAGRIKRITSPPVAAGEAQASSTPLDFVTLMRYDAMDRPLELTYPDGVTITYGYNAQSLLESIPGYVDRIHYTASGQRTALATGDGIRTTYQYDSRLRLLALKSVDRTDVILQDLHYRFDGVSNIVGIEDARPGRTPADDDSQTFVLDDLYRLTKVTYTNGSADSIDYTYDPVGNLVRQTSTVPTANLGELIYGQGAGPHALTQVGGDTWRYDANGNLSTKAGWTYAWDIRDRLASATARTAFIQDHTYDYAGERVQQARDDLQRQPDLSSILTGPSRCAASSLSSTFSLATSVWPRYGAAFSPGRLIHGFAGSRPYMASIERGWCGHSCGGRGSRRRYRKR